MSANLRSVRAAWHKRRWTRIPLLAVTPLFVLVAIEATFRASVAAAIVKAPNFGRSSVDEGRSSDPKEHGVDEVLRVSVGPPAATLSAWVLEPRIEPPIGTVLVLHGIRLDKSSTLEVGRALADSGFRAVMPDLRGHGQSTGSYLSYGAIESRDVSQLIDAGLARGWGPKIGVWGYSYGAAVAVTAAAHDHRISAAVAVAPFASLRSAVSDYEARYLRGAKKLIPQAWIDGAVQDAAAWVDFDATAESPAAVAPSLGAPLLLVHGEADTQVRPDNSRALLTLAPHAELLFVPGASHEAVLSDGTGDVRRASVAWFTRFFGTNDVARGALPRRQ